jgi:hypothetical protein
MCLKGGHVKAKSTIANHPLSYWLPMASVLTAHTQRWLQGNLDARIPKGISRDFEKFLQPALDYIEVTIHTSRLMRPKRGYNPIVSRQRWLLINAIARGLDRQMRWPNSFEAIQGRLINWRELVGDDPKVMGPAGLHYHRRTIERLSLFCSTLAIAGEVAHSERVRAA